MEILTLFPLIPLNICEKRFARSSPNLKCLKKEILLKIAIYHFSASLSAVLLRRLSRGLQIIPNKHRQNNNILFANINALYLLSVGHKILSATFSLTFASPHF